MTTAWWWKRPYCALAGHDWGRGGYSTVSWFSSDLGRTVRYRRSTCWRCGARHKIGLHVPVDVRARDDAAYEAGQRATRDARH